MRRDLLLLAETIDAAEQASDIAAELTAEDLTRDRRSRAALAWHFTVLGEAATQVSPETKARFPHIAWQQPARLRNRLVHGYWSIDVDLLHATASDDLPPFTRQVRAALAALEAGAAG